MSKKKKGDNDTTDDLLVNTSPVCYANSPELRPGFNEEINKGSNTSANTEKGRKTNNSKKTHKP